MEKFTCKTQIISGENALDALKELKSQRLLLVTDPYFVESGQAQEIIGRINAPHKEIFSKVAPDPTAALAAEGTAVVKAFSPDTVVALGGGSAMDCAKAMLYFSGRDISLIAIPTTSGSGSEVTDFSVLTHQGVKHPLIDEKLCPKMAILDSSLLLKLPKSLIADAGFDILSHALESFVATNAGAITDALALEAFCTGYALLPKSFMGDVSVRGKLHTAATMAGLAFNQSGLGLCHALCHALGGEFHISHGRLGAIFLPEVVRCNAHAVGGKYANLARRAGLPGAADTVAVRNLIGGLCRLRRELKMPENLRQAGIDPALVRSKSKALVEATLADPCCKTNPMAVEDFMIRRILEAVS